MRCGQGRWQRIPMAEMDKNDKVLRGGIENGREERSYGDVTEMGGRRPTHRHTRDMGGGGETEG